MWMVALPAGLGILTPGPSLVRAEEGRGERPLRVAAFR